MRTQTTTGKLEQRLSNRSVANEAALDDHAGLHRACAGGRAASSR
jgi:hypothetical protein